MSDTDLARFWFRLHSWFGPGLVHAETWRRGGRKSVDDTVETLLERCAAEVDEQADRQIHEAKIRSAVVCCGRGRVSPRT